MKELSIEQKAKAYDEALKRAKEWYDNPNSSSIGKGYIYAIFPELKESEDEKIRKRISQALHGDVLDFDEIIQADAWLEKQGEQTNLPKFTFDDVLALQCCMETVKKVQEDKDLYEKLNDLHDRVHDAYHLEKQGEQKPIKVPKFKAGDFIQFNGMGHTRYTIKEVCGLSHYINTCDKRMDMSYTDANFELVEQKSAEWKPSDEQLEALKNAIHIKPFENPSDSILWGLYEQLNKLKS